MKLLDMTCPNCGSKMTLDRESGECTCNYCGSSFLMDYETQHIQYDNAEAAGYEFEKGRQEAQAEAHRNITTSYNTVQVNSMPRKRKTWLWVLGWLFVFPLPLMILLLRNKKLNNAIKWTLISVAWIIYLVIALSGNGSDRTGNTQVVSNSDNSVNVIETSASNETEARYVEDEVVNRFITEYNNSYDVDLTDIEKGNIRTKYFVYAGSTRMELLNANDAYAEVFCVRIYGGNDDAAQESMFAHFLSVARVLDPSVTDEDVEKAISEFKEKDLMMDSYHLGTSLTVTYIPTSGVLGSRIDIDASEYK